MPSMKTTPWMTAASRGEPFNDRQLLDAESSSLKTIVDGLPRTQEHRADRLAGRPRRRLGLAEVRRRRTLAYDDVLAEAQGLFADELAPSAAGSPVGVVGVIDESAFTKKGAHSAGVARQHNGRLGKEDNCQVGVFLIGVTPAGPALLDHRLFLPEVWCADTPEAKQQREAAHIPEDVTFRTKPQIAAELIRNVAVLDQVALDGVVGDSEYGRAGHLLDELELLEQRYVLAVPKTWVFWTSEPAESVPADSGRGRKPTAPRRDAARTVVEIAHALPVSAWTALQVREGALGPLVFAFAAVRVWGLRHRQPGPPSWLLIRRSLGPEPELKYYVSNADADTPLSTLALVACTRCRVETCQADSTSSDRWCGPPGARYDRCRRAA